MKVLYKLSSYFTLVHLEISSTKTITITLTTETKRISEVGKVGVEKSTTVATKIYNIVSGKLFKRYYMFEPIQWLKYLNKSL